MNSFFFIFNKNDVTIFIFFLMIVTIRFGDQSKPINTNCKNGVILEHIRSCAGVDNSVIVDLCDKDGNVKLLRSNPTAYATSYLQSGETYFFVSAQEEAKQYVYSLLVNLKPDENAFDIKPTKLDKKESKKPPSKQSSKGKKGK